MNCGTGIKDRGVLQRILINSFPIQLLEPYYGRDEAELLPMPELEDEPDEYEVEEVKDKALIKGQIRYLVKWTGWPSEYNQWVDEADIAKSPARVRAYEKVSKQKGRPMSGAN
jgi:hypothetical protein